MYLKYIYIYRAKVMIRTENMSHTVQDFVRCIIIHLNCIICQYESGSSSDSDFDSNLDLALH